jgi:hypothetical protein
MSLEFSVPQAAKADSHVLMSDNEHQIAAEKELSASQKNVSDIFVGRR